MDILHDTSEDQHCGLLFCCSGRIEFVFRLVSLFPPPWCSADRGEVECVPRVSLARSPPLVCRCRGGETQRPGTGEEDWQVQPGEGELQAPRITMQGNSLNL